MNIAELQRKSELARKLKATLENQKLILETMALADQSVWHDSELESRAREIEREVAREVVGVARQWLDLFHSTERAEKRAEGEGKAVEPDDLPF